MFSFFLAKDLLALQPGDQAIDFVLETVNVDNSRVTESILKRRNGEEYLLLFFYQSHCIPSRNSFPYISRLKKEFSSKLAIKLINSDKSMAEIEDYFTEFRDMTQFPVAIEDNYAAVRAYGRKYTPTFFILNKKNKIVYRYIGTPSESTMRVFRSKIK